MVLFKKNFWLVSVTAIFGLFIFFSSPKPVFAQCVYLNGNQCNGGFGECSSVTCGSSDCPAGYHVSGNANANNFCSNLVRGGGAGACCEPNGQTWDCGTGTALDSYCHVGPNCGNSHYHYSNLYACDPNIWDGCCVICPAAQTCDAGTAGGLIPNGTCGWTQCPAQCTGTSCTAWGTCNAPANTCDAGNGSQSRFCTWDLPNGCRNYNRSNFNQTQGCTTNNCYAGYTCPGGTCLGTITVHVYIDYGHDGGLDANYPYGIVTINNGGATTTGSDGTVVYQKPTGTYAISYTDNSPDFVQIGATSQNVTLNAGTSNVTVNFRVTPLYSISGNIFNDKNKNLNYDGSPDTLYTNTTTIHVSGGPTSVSDMTQTDGTYATPENLLSGTYTVSQTHALASGFSYTTPSTWSITVGNPAGNPKCNKSTSPDAGCVNPNAGSISNLNIGVTDENAWNQEACFDVRNDSGSYTNQIPAAPSCGGVSGAYNTIQNGSCSTGSGIVFTCNATGDFGFGSANADNWTSGGTTAQTQECYTSAGLDVIRTSYDYLETTARESNITPTDMNGVAVCGAGGIANCTLSAGLRKGIYQATGNVNLNQYVFPAPSDPTTTAWSYIFLINGDLHINGNVLIPKGSVAVFSVSGNIYVDPSVGQVITNTASASNNNPNIEGLYSADGSFIINSYGSAGNFCNADGTPKDKKLNILGSVVVNASKGGGTITNNRDLCIYDYECAPVSGGDGTGTSNAGSSGTSGATGPGTLMNYLLTLLADGQFLNHKSFNWQELRP